MSLSEKLVGVPPGETGGAVATARLGFQQVWALYYAFELHEAGEPYAILLEFHDDIAVLNHESQPTEIELIQVKTTSKPFTHSQILKVEAPSGKTKQARSIMGKLVSHCAVFEPHIRKLMLVARPGFKKEALANGSSNGDHHFYSVVDLSSEARLRYESALAAELGSGLSIPWSKVFFRACDMSLKECDEHCIGRLTHLLEAVSREGEELRARPFYRTLKARLTRTLANENQQPTLQELAAASSLRRSDIEKAIDDCRFARHRRRFSETKADLIASSISLAEIDRLEDGWGQYACNQMDPSSKLHIVLRERIVDTVQAVIASDSWGESLGDFLRTAYLRFVAIHGEPIAPISSTELRGGILLERARERERKFSTPPQESAIGAD